MSATVTPGTATRAEALTIFETAGCSAPRSPGNGPEETLSAGTRHAATVGPAGCACLEAWRP